MKYLPDGNIYYNKNGKYIKWLVSGGHRPKVISKSNRELAEKLAYRKYLLTKRGLLSAELNLIKPDIMTAKAEESKLDKLLNDEVYLDLLSGYISNDFKDYDEWANAPFETNSFHPEHLKIKTVNDLMVRSKSEHMIARELFLNKIPFRYECLLELGANNFKFPDFTIIKPSTGKKFYWENFGMMDDPKYVIDDFVRKMPEYCKHGIIPGDNLICTFETKDNPLTLDVIEKSIQMYLL